MFTLNLILDLRINRIIFNSLELPMLKLRIRILFIHIRILKLVPEPMRRMPIPSKIVERPRPLIFRHRGKIFCSMVTTIQVLRNTLELQPCSAPKSGKPT